MNNGWHLSRFSVGCSVKNEVAALGIGQEALHASDAETALDHARNRCMSSTRAETCCGFEMREPTEVFKDLT